MRADGVQAGGKAPCGGLAPSKLLAGCPVADCKLDKMAALLEIEHYFYK
jgi:hypothetical protein